jgi:ribosomal protein S18 acetylase RimI-like enzyme
MTVTQSTVDVHPASSAELSEVATALSRAFYDDRIFRWIIPDDAQRSVSVPAAFAVFAEAFFPHGAVYVAGGGAGGALWLPPGEQLVADDQVEAFIGRLAAVSGTDEDAARMGEVVELLESNHPHDMPHWYLNFVGVDPAFQGRGIGSALMAPVLAQADRDGVAAYLEATSPDNQRLYERHGFRTIRELSVADCPPLYAMWREPQAWAGPAVP